MSEEKLYAVKDDKGKYWDFYNEAKGFDPDYVSWLSTTQMRDKAEKAAKKTGGHVVTFVEEPKKVVITKEQAEIVERAHDSEYPASCISSPLLMNAYVNGYTVAKEKKYLAFKELGGKQKNKKVAQAYRSFVFPNTITWSIEGRESLNTPSTARFTESEIEHYGLQDCEKEEVTDDEN